MLKDNKKWGMGGGCSGCLKEAHLWPRSWTSTVALMSCGCARLLSFKAICVGLSSPRCTWYSLPVPPMDSLAEPLLLQSLIRSRSIAIMFLIVTSGSECFSELCSTPQQNFFAPRLACGLVYLHITMPHTRPSMIFRSQVFLIS